VGFILRISLRPSLYSSADQLAAQLIGDPKVLAQVIWKLEAYSQTLPFRSPASAAHLFMVSPLNLRKWERFFIAQPKPHRRIQAILGYYPV
jgi:Zn-dependent protease with chaperone function